MLSQDEVEKIVNLLKIADGSCQYCVSNLSLNVIESFPNYRRYVEKKLIKYKKT